MEEEGPASKKARLDPSAEQAAPSSGAPAAGAEPPADPAGAAATAGEGAEGASAATADPPAAGGAAAAGGVEPEAQRAQPGGAGGSGGLQEGGAAAGPDGSGARAAAAAGGGAAPPGSAAPAAAEGDAPLGADGAPVPVGAEGAAQGKYTAREAQWLTLEQEGGLRFVYVLNDGHPDNSRWLVGLKNVFSKQLPNMPKEYISRLVFDRRHRSVAIVQIKDNAVTGGITYRPFHSQRFAEIAFCAVTGPQQVRGFGTRLMNYTKKYAREMDACEYFLTYADNSAVGYFAKQSFTKEITMPKERWHGFIKDYDGGTLMECYIHPHLPFTDFPAMIQAQKRALDARIRQFTSSHIVYPGLVYFRGAEVGAKPPLSIDDIPGVTNANWSAETAELMRPRFRVVLNGVAVDATPPNLQAFMASMLQRIKKDEDSWPFREPVTEELAPDYFDVIKAPMDLATMERRLEGGHFYITLDIFVADMNRIFNNSKVYNSSDTVYYKLAAKLQGQFQQLIHANVLYDEPLPE